MALNEMMINELEKNMKGRDSRLVYGIPTFPGKDHLAE
jgi:hypothetical protein